MEIGKEEFRNALIIVRETKDEYIIELIRISKIAEVKNEYSISKNNVEYDLCQTDIPKVIYPIIFKIIRGKYKIAI